MNEELKEAALNTEKKCIPCKRQREDTGYQTDEDCVSGHCCDASASITKLEAKIDKLLDLFTEIASLKVRLTEVEEETKQLKKAAEYTGKELTDLKTNMCSQTASGTGEMQNLNMEIQQLNAATSNWRRAIEERVYGSTTSRKLKVRHHECLSL